MHHENCLVDFYEQWENLLKKGETTEPDTPRITRTLPIIKWTESFEEFLHQVLGVQSVPLSYIIREQSAVDPAPLPWPIIDHTLTSISQSQGSCLPEHPIRLPTISPTIRRYLNTLKRRRERRVTAAVLLLSHAPSMEGGLGRLSCHNM